MGSIDDGRAVGQALLDHPDHEIYDGALPGEITSAERFLGVQLPPSYRGVLEIGSGGILADGDFLLGTKDPEALGESLHEVARAAWEAGLPRRYLPIVDGARLVCLDLEDRDSAGECPVVEVDGDTFEEVARWRDFPTFAREVLLEGPTT